jgi:energy-coupling factor transporter ATP-binding protein EcfA2
MNENLALSLRLLRQNAAELGAVWVPSGQKAATYRVDFGSLDAQTKASEALMKLEQQEAPLQPAAVIRGNFVDVDLDEVNPVLESALATFLATPLVFGRRTKPRSHFFLRLSEPFENGGRLFGFVKTAKGLGLNLELRGGADNRSNYTILPGGLHPSGEEIQWWSQNHVESYLDSTPTQMTPTLFAKALRKAIVAATLVDCWHSGNRHALAMALAGMLYKNHRALVDEGGDEAIALHEQDCLDVVTFICDAAGDTEITDRLTAVRATWRKDDVEKIAGYSTLVQILGEAKARLLRISLAGSAYLDKLEELSDKLAYYPAAEAFIVLDEIPVFGLTFKSPGGYAAAYPQHVVELPGKDGKMVHAAKQLRRLSMTRDVARFFFDPHAPRMVPDEDNDGAWMLNTFSGWAVDPWPEPVKASDPDIQPVVAHLDYLFDDSTVVNWVMAWFADIAQRPTDKPGTALVLVGEQGAGKSSLIQILGGFLGAGPNVTFNPVRSHFAVVDRLETLTGKFNSATAGKLLVQGEEIIQGASSRRTDNLHTASVLKSLITNKLTMHEKKGFDAFAVPDHCRYILTSNSVDKAARLEESDRRYTVALVSSKNKDDFTYWGNLFSHVERKEVRAKIFRFLMDYQYNRAMIARPVHTAARDAMQEETMRREESALPMNLLRFLVQRQGNPFPIEVHKHPEDACTWAVRELFRRDPVKRHLFRDAWPEFITSELWLRMVEYYAKEKMGVPPPGSRKAHFLGAMFDMPKSADGKYGQMSRWKSEGGAPDVLRRHIPFPTRAQMYDLVKASRRLTPTEVEEIEGLIRADADYRAAEPSYEEIENSF